MCNQAGEVGSIELKLKLIYAIRSIGGPLIYVLGRFFFFFFKPTETETAVAFKVCIKSIFSWLMFLVFSALNHMAENSMPSISTSYGSHSRPAPKQLYVSKFLVALRADTRTADFY